MLNIQNSNIYIVRGDSGDFRPVIQDYEAQEGDKVVFAAKKARNEDEPVIKIEVNAGENISFTPELLKDIKAGSYEYDLRLKTVDGKVSTFASGRLLITGEIDNEGN